MTTSESENNVLRTAIMRIMSEMLDDPDEYGLYDTGRFMNRIEELLKSMMAAPEVMQLSGSEAVFGFIGQLTAKHYMDLKMAQEDNAIWIGWCKEFCETNHLTEPREEWHTLLTHPNGEAKAA